MAALPSYIPARDADFNNWLNNFSTLLSATPALYGLTAVDAASVAAVTATWNATYLLVTSPSTKTADAVSAKNTAKVNANSGVRPYAQQISLNAGVASSDKIAIGVNPRTSTPTPITPPTTNPVLTLQSCSNLSAYVRYRDSAASVSVKAKPFGVLQLQLFGTTSATIVTDPTTLPLKGTPTKSPFVLTFSSADIGKQFYCAGRWVTRNGQVGPWSGILSFTVVGAG